MKILLIGIDRFKNHFVADHNVITCRAELVEWHDVKPRTWPVKEFVFKMESSHELMDIPSFPLASR